MPSFLQLQPIAFDDVAETLFMGGTEIIRISRTRFETQSGEITIRWKGHGLGFAADGTLESGIVDEFRVCRGPFAIENQLIIGDSSFDLLTFEDFNRAFSLAAAGDLSGAVALVNDIWSDEPFSINTLAGGYLRGYQGDDFFSARGPSVRAEGFGGNDIFLLGLSNDRAYGGTGSDFLEGNGGDDRLFGGAGRDDLEGQDGDDALFGGSGRDTVYGGVGSNELHGGTGNDEIVGWKLVDRAHGDAGDDDVSGNDGDDFLFGDAGNDRLYGQQGSDQLFGGTGLDQLFSGQGSDFMTGGDDADRFFAASVAVGTDTIMDFEDDIDTIRFLGFDFADAAAVLALATEIGNDVEFALGEDQVLTVRNATVAALTDDLIV